MDDQKDPPSPYSPPMVEMQPSVSTAPLQPNAPIPNKDPVPPPPYSPPVVEMQPSVSTTPLQPNAPIPTGWLPPSMTYLPDLQCLMELDYLFLNREIKFLKSLCRALFSRYDSERTKYVVMDIRDEPMFYVLIEVGSFCARFRKKPSLEFIVHDRYRQREILHINFLFKYGCFYEEMYSEVYSGNTLLGSVTEESTIARTIFYIRDASGQPMLMLKGMDPFDLRMKFKVESIDGNHNVGMIQQQSDGKLFSLSTNLHIIFSRDLDVKIKVLLLAACVFIDYIHYTTRK